MTGENQMLKIRSFLAISSLLILCLALWGCGKKESADTTSEEGKTEVAATATPEGEAPVAMTPAETPAEEAAATETPAESAASPAAETTEAKSGNLVPNSKLETAKDQSSVRDLIVFKEDYYTTRTEPNPDGGNILIIEKNKGAKKGENFYHVGMELPVESGKIYKVGYSYQVSKDFKADKIGVQVRFYPEKENGLQASMSDAIGKPGEWTKVTFSVTAPEGTDKMRLVFPRIFAYKAGSITVKEPFVEPAD